MKFKALFTVTFLVSTAVQASAATCSTNQLSSYARVIAEKELASANLAIAKQRVQLELENQTRIVAAMEQQFQTSLLAANSFPNLVKANAVSLLQSSFAKSRITFSRVSNLSIADSNRAVRNAQLRFDYANRAAGRTPNCESGSSSPGVVPAATITLEALNIRTGQTARNGSSLTVTAGDSIQYRWSASNAPSATSTYRITSGPNLCGWATQATWLNDMKGTGAELATVQLCQRGTTYEITFRPQNASGFPLGEQKLIVVVQ